MPLTWNMLPFFTKDNRSDTSPADAKDVREFLLRGKALVMHRTNSHNVSRAKLRGPFFFSVYSLLSSFFNTVLHIVFNGSTKQMGWIAARRIVAFVTNQLTFRDWSIFNLPRHPMSHRPFVVFSRWAKDAVSMNICFSFKRPAFVWSKLSDTVPKPLIHRNAAMFFESHKCAPLFWRDRLNINL